jgi:phospholipid/cholesterol/gamma-HCH transport system ATP-binding protein
MAASGEPARIELVDVWKAFGGTPVLAGVNLAVTPGESLVIIGGSGAGKSVTLKCVLGLERPDRGRVMIDGIAAERLDRAAFLARTGMLFQGAALFDSLPVWQNVAFRLINARRPMRRRAARDLAVEKLARVGLGAAVADLYPAELSGGMQKRVGLARAIAADPEILFCDEPTAGLDPILAGVINELIRGIVEEMGATALTITHDMTTVRTVADRVAMLHGGVVRWQGPAAAVDSAADPYLAQFVAGRSDGPIETLR